MKNVYLCLSLLIFSHVAFSQCDPQLTSWWFNTDNLHFYHLDSAGTVTDSTLVDVEQVHYNTNFVWVVSSGIPSYYMDDQSVFDAEDQDWTYRLPRNPTVQTSGAISLVDEGVIGVLIDGSVALSPGDGQSWQSLGEWNQLAYEHEGLDFDSANGHSTPQNIYHHHIDPNYLYPLDPTKHSPIVGFALDGYPIYGPFAFENTDGTGGISRMQTSWKTRNMTVRNTLPDGTSSSGPPFNSNHPLGSYWEDYEYDAGYGHLDEHNGRWTVTPEYPGGTYAYFITRSSTYEPEFPYIVGESYYGELDMFNQGPNAGNANILASAVQYYPLQATTSSVDASCNASDGSASVTVSGGNAGYTYQWSNSVPASTIINQPAGTYTVTVTDSDTCSLVATVTIDQPCDMPTNLKVANIQDVTVDLQWDEACDAAGYRIYYKETSASNWTVANKQTNKGKITLSGLSPETKYRYTIRTRCSDDSYSDWYPTATFTTLGAPCVAPGTLSSDVHNTSVRLNWSKESNAFKYRIRYQVQGSGSWTTLLKDSTWDKHWLSGLQANTTYNWQIKSVCQRGSSSGSKWSDEQTFTTGSTLFVAPTAEPSTPFEVRMNVELFPNPSSGPLQIQLSQDEIVPVLITIRDLYGKTLYQRQEAGGNRLIGVSVAETLSTGIYFVEVTDGQGDSAVVRWAKR